MIVRRELGAMERIADDLARAQWQRRLTWHTIARCADEALAHLEYLSLVYGPFSPLQHASLQALFTDYVQLICGIGQAEDAAFHRLLQAPRQYKRPPP
jgi:hypothetical protein